MQPLWLLWVALPAAAVAFRLPTVIDSNMVLARAPMAARVWYRPCSLVRSLVLPAVHVTGAGSQGLWPERRGGHRHTGRWQQLAGHHGCRRHLGSEHGSASGRLRCARPGPRVALGSF